MPPPFKNPGSTTGKRDTIPSATYPPIYILAYKPALLKLDSIYCTLFMWTHKHVTHAKSLEMYMWSAYNKINFGTYFGLNPHSPEE